MSSEYAQKLAYNDVWNLDFDEETIKPFLDYRYIDKFQYVIYRYLSICFW